MPNWRKVIVSGQDALLNSVTTPQNVINDITASYAINTSTTAVNTGTVIEITPAQSTWTINHSVNERYPIVTCWEADSNEIIQPDVVRSLGLDTVQVEFTRPVAGFANVSRAGHVISGSFAQTASWAINATTTAINSGTVLEITPAQTVWTLHHNTHERYPIVTCWESGSNEVIQPDQIRSLNWDIVEVTFTRPVAGYANVSRAGHVLSGSWQSLQGAANITASGLYGGFTGSLQGTASFADTSLTASYALTAGVATLLSSTASQALTASYSGFAATASYATTASHIHTLSQDVNITGSVSINGVLTLQDVLAAQYLSIANYSNDAQAAAGGIPLWGIYRSGNLLIVRIE